METTADDRPLVLIIEDNVETANALSLLLEDWGFAYLAAESPAAAVRALGDRITEVQALITDFHLHDGFTGIKGAVAVHNAVGRPVPTLITTGFLDLAETLDSFPVLSKPFDPSVLHQWLSYQMQQRDASR
ncbi:MULTISPECIES: response regulator [Rhodomicrobium]|uniref:response regulator n=1 Tax=Rhodomicrobium TaxID=1068 RepID=UPI000B4B2047|nr:MULTISPECIES: response regulator [Rhodomicrobium]